MTDIEAIRDREKRIAGLERLIAFDGRAMDMASGTINELNARHAAALQALNAAISNGDWASGCYKAKQILEGEE